MVFDELGLPKITGAGDLQDSVHLAGLVVGSAYKPEVDMHRYIVLAGESVPWYKTENNALVRLGNYTFFADTLVRHPLQYIYDTSRDQTLAAWWGFYKQGLYHLVGRKFVNGRDVFDFAARGHELRCQNKAKEVRWYHNLNLILAILWHAIPQSTSEPCQLIAMMDMAGPKYMKLWTAVNRRWKNSIKRYFCAEDGAWRQEPEFAEYLIGYVYGVAAQWSQKPLK